MSVDLLLELSMVVLNQLEFPRIVLRMNYEGARTRTPFHSTQTKLRYIDDSSFGSNKCSSLLHCIDVKVMMMRHDEPKRKLFRVRNVPVSSYQVFGS